MTYSLRTVEALTGKDQIPSTSFPTNYKYLREFYGYNMQLPPKEEVHAAVCGDLS